MFTKYKRVKKIFQKEKLDCAIICLAMILSYHKKKFKINELKKKCKISEKGYTAKDIINVSKEYGLFAKGFKGELCHLKNNVPMPCIVYWDFNHFVVLKGISDKYAFINNPSSKESKIPLSDFLKSFSGVYIQFDKNGG